MDNSGYYNNNLYEMEQLDLNNDNRVEGNLRKDYNNSAKKQKGRTRHEILQEQAISGGYGSDGSETLSVNSAQSMQNRYNNIEILVLLYKNNLIEKINLNGGIHF